MSWKDQLRSDSLPWLLKFRIPAFVILLSAMCLNSLPEIVN